METLTPFQIRQQLRLDTASKLLVYSGKCEVCGRECKMLNGTNWCTNTNCFLTVFNKIDNNKNQPL